MSKFIKKYVPTISIVFTFIIIVVTIYNVINGETKDDYCYFVLEVVGYLISSIAIDYFVSLINFKKYLNHFLVEVILLYPVTVGFAILGNWFHIDLISLSCFSSFYIIMMTVLHYYFYSISKKQADEINRILHMMNSR